MKFTKSKKIEQNPLYEVWDQVPVDYYQSGVRQSFLQNLWHTKKINLAKKILNKKKFKKCLDVGCASGYMVSEISIYFPDARYTGIDSYDKAINHGKKSYPHIKFLVADAEKLPFKKEEFDLLICYETIEHVTNPLQALIEMKRVLKKNGNLVLTMDSGSLLFRIVWFVWENTKGKVWKGAHLHPFNHEELARIIKKAGFKINQKIFSHLGMEVTFILSKN